MSKLQAIVTSPPDRQNVVFEIWCGSSQVAEISKEPGRDYEVEIYPALDNVAWRFNLMEFKEMLDGGIRELVNNP